MVVLELGDFMHTDPVMGRVYNEYLLDSMEREGMQAMVPGVRELSNYPEFVSLLADRSIEVVCSNVALAGEGGEASPIGRRSKVITVADVRIGLLGVVGTEEFGKVSPPEGIGFDLQAPAEAIGELAPALADSADIVVVMAAMGDKDATALAGELEQVDMLFGGHFSIASRNPLLAGDVIVSRSGLRGIFLATTRVIVSPDGEIVDWYGYNYELEETFPSDPAIAAEVEQVEARAKEVRRDALLRRSQGLESQVIPERYLGVAVCRRCHPAEFHHWRETPHAHAMETLVAEDRAHDPECVRCHITGPLPSTSGSAGTAGAAETTEVAGAAEASRSAGAAGAAETTEGAGAAGAAGILAVDAAFHHVQCEACHGPGSEHRRGEGMAVVPERVCVGCHTPDWSPDWSYEQAVQEVCHAN